MYYGLTVWLVSIAEYCILANTPELHTRTPAINHLSGLHEWAETMNQTIALPYRSLDQKPVFRIINRIESATGITLLIETPIPVLWLDEGYVWNWSYNYRQKFSAPTEKEAISIAEQRMQWIIEWEYRKATEVFYSEQRTANSEQRTANSEQRTANSEQRTANSEQRTANSEQRTANSEQRTANYSDQLHYLNI